jgi:hypothetical protein
MTEQEWLNCTDSAPMLEFLKGKGSERKVRLFVVALARSLWEKIDRQDMRQAIKMAESFADGQATAEQLDQHKGAMFDYATGGTRDQREWLSKTKENQSIFWLVVATTYSGQGLGNIVGTGSWHHGRILTEQHQPQYVRELFGNPFRLITINPNWLVWNDRTVPRIAQAIYDERAFDRMPVLGDALEDAGCQNADILNHCRSDGPHVKGCWVLDLLLSRE